MSNRKTVLVPFNQDDRRERAMVLALNLFQRPDRARHDEDAYYKVSIGKTTNRLLFELKSKPADGDYGTGRDTGPRQLRRWAQMHFAFGIFDVGDDRPQELWYGSPRTMATWIERELDYVRLDGILGDLVPELIGPAVAAEVFGAKDLYTYDDMRRLMKDQWNYNAATERPNLYDQYADVMRGTRRADNLYSPEAAVWACRERVQYLLGRGATVNNRKISHSYVEAHCLRLDPPYARSLDQAVSNEMKLLSSYS
jgi:hypothetical protein